MLDWISLWGTAVVVLLFMRCGVTRIGAEFHIRIDVGRPTILLSSLLVP